MAQSTLVLLIEILFLVSCVSHIATTAADYAGDVIHVAGKVLCQDCSLSYEQWINGSEPIKGIIIGSYKFDFYVFRIVCFIYFITARPPIF